MCLQFDVAGGGVNGAGGNGMGRAAKIGFQTVEGDFRIRLVSKAKSMFHGLFIHSGSTGDGRKLSS